jgi:DNA repair protein RecO (recombination protein O)
MLYTLRGLVVRETIASDNAKYINVLTAERGKISVLVKGSTKMRGRFTAPTQIFSYSEFVLYEHGGKYSLNDASLIENYFYLCRDFTTITLGTYVLNAAEFLINEEQPDTGILRLALNTLWALSHKERRDIRLIKGAFEIRLAALAGFAPDLTGCGDCKTPLGSETLFLNVMEGCLFCRNCIEKRQKNVYNENEIKVDSLRTAQIVIPLDPAVIYAMRYAIFADMSRLFSFSLSETLVPQFLNICERYIENHIEHRFPVLDMLEF